MKRILPVLFLLVGVIGSRYVIHKPAALVENGVYIGNQLPYWGEVCESTLVYGSPRVDTVSFDVVMPGDKIVLHELSHVNGDWVMIRKAQWIPLSAVCDW